MNFNDRNVPLPVWFEEDALRGQEFDAETYVSDLTRYVPINTVCAQLETYLTQLKHQLVEAINARYNEFVGLATQLGGVEGAIVRIARPITDLKTKLEVLQRGIESELSLLTMNLDRRQNVKTTRRTLQTIQSAVQISAKVEKLMGEVKRLGQGSDLAIRSALMERLCREIGHIDIVLKDSPETELTKALSIQNEKTSSEVVDILTDLLEEALRLQEPDHSSVIGLLNSFSVIDRKEKAETVLRDMLAKPALSTVALDKNLGPVSDAILRGIDEAYGGIIDVILSNPNQLQKYDLLGNCVVAALHDRIIKTYPQILSPGNPDLFLENYKAWTHLIEKLEMKCSSIAALSNFRNGEALKRFSRAWNLQVYFAMRFQEIAGTMDEALTKGTRPTRNADGRFSFGFVSVWLQCLRQCSNPQIVTESLSDQFIKLFFKLLSRFKQWALLNIDTLHKGDKPAGDFPSENDDIVLLEKDLRESDSELRSRFYSAALPEACQSPVDDCVDKFCEGMQEMRHKLLKVIERRLIEDCCGTLKKIIGQAASSMYRPGGDRPVYPNEYVTRIFPPLESFLESEAVAKHLEDWAKSEVKVAVARTVCSRYLQALDDNLSFRERSQQSLQKIQKRSAGSSKEMDSNELSNVYHQYWLDISSIGDILKDLGVEGLQEYQDLRDFIISKKESNA